MQRKKGVLRNRCMQDAGWIPYLWVSSSVWSRGVCKTYLSVKQKSFSPIEMLYNILWVHYDIHYENEMIIITIRIKVTES